MAMASHTRNRCVIMDHELCTLAIMSWRCMSDHCHVRPDDRRVQKISDLEIPNVRRIGGSDAGLVSQQIYWQLFRLLSTRCHGSPRISPVRDASNVSERGKHVISPEMLPH